MLMSFAMQIVSHEGRYRFFRKLGDKFKKVDDRLKKLVNKQSKVLDIF